MKRLGVILLLLELSISSFAAEFYRKQTGTATIANGNTSTTATITAVDLTQSFLVFSSTISNADPTNVQIGGTMSNATTLTFIRTGNTGAVTIKWQVFEFEGGVYVQRGSSGVPLSTNVDITLECIDVSKSFPIISGRKSGSQVGNDDGVTADITSSTNLRLATGTAGGNYEEIYWQVVEYQAATVKRVTGSIANGNTSGTGTIAPAVTNLSKAFVLSNHIIGGDVTASSLPRTELTNTTTVTYTRSGTTSAMTFISYVIEFTDQTTVTRGSQTFTGTTSQNVSITAGASSGVFGSGLYGRQGSTNHGGSDDTGHCWFTYEITSGTNLQIVRATAAGSTNAVAPWQIVTFEDTGVQQNTLYSRATGDWETNTTWSFTPDGSSGAVPSGVYPTRRNNVVIQNGHTVTVNSVTDNGPCSTSPDALPLANVGSFTGSGDQMFYQTGDLLIANGGTLAASEEVMLAGYTLIENGGTFTIAEDIINLGYLEVASGGNFSNTDDLILSGNSITIINNLSFGADDIYIDWTNATLCGSGVMNLGNGGPDPTIQFFNGGSLNQVCSSFSVTCTSNCGAFPITPTGSFFSGNRGPGGVGAIDGTSPLKLWFRTDSGISSSGGLVDSWANSAGVSTLNISETGAQRPTLVGSAVNGFSEVSFSGSNRLRTGLNLTTTNFVTNQASTFVVCRADNTTQTSSVYLTDPLETNRFSCHIPWSNVVYYDIGDCCTNDARLNVTGLTGLTGYSVWSYDANPTTGKQLYRNGSLLQNRANTLTYSSHATHRFNIGANTTGSNGFQGDVTETIIFREKINTMQRQLIDNYLAAKFGLTLSANDFYTMDDPGNGSFDFDVAGIGQASDGSQHRDSRGTGIVRMWNPGNLANSEYLLWGHDGAGLTGTTSGVDGTIIQERFNRTWRVSETGDVGTVSISFDFTGIGNPLGSNLRLLIDRDGDGFTDNDVTPIVGTVSSNVAVFSGINLQNGDRFTLGNTDSSSPLPVELVEFSAWSQGEEVVISWATASEVNNDYFVVERSKDAEQWQSIEQVSGAGTSYKSNSYQVIDRSPHPGINYYRLKQVDFDGQFDTSHIVKVLVDGSSSIKIFPNPTTDQLHVDAQFDEGVFHVQLFNSLGQLVTPARQAEGSLLSIDVAHLPSGVYILQILRESTISSFRVIKK
ncbi:MAG: T9SS type A sorting domain-containing protein [Cyclobacteriaceae bacterium]